MKSILAALGVFLLGASAFALEFPPEPCGGLRCSAPMLAIAEEFRQGGAPDPAHFPRVASGNCYHSTFMYDPETVHHGVVLLDEHEGGLYMGGQFSFYAPENPYRDWTVERAREATPKLYADNHRLELGPDFAFSDMNPGGETMWNYWLRQTGERLYLLGQWGTGHRVFCALEPHP